jgi:hypothetical protein
VRTASCATSLMPIVCCIACCAALQAARPCA